MQPATHDRRTRNERRKRTLAAYWRGARNPRRRDGRRAQDRLYPIVDWHSARVFALIMLILTLCVVDGVMTVVLISHGAVEANPIMALLVPHELGWFAVAKLSLTAVGMMVLAVCSRMRVFRGIPGETFLYAVLAAYVWLIVYELRLYQYILQEAA